MHKPSPDLLPWCVCVCVCVHVFTQMKQLAALTFYFQLLFHSSVQIMGDSRNTFSFVTSLQREPAVPQKTRLANQADYP